MLMAKKPKNNWDRLSSQTPGETTRYRDVYEDQQLERTQIEPKKTMTSRTILAAAAGIGVTLFSYLLISMILNMASSFLGGSASSSGGGSGGGGGGSSGYVAEWDKEKDGPRPLSEAPTDLTMDELKSDYLTEPAAGEDGIVRYADSEANGYVEADLPPLLERIHGREYMSEDRKAAEDVLLAAQANEYGVIPLAYAPTNISFNEFLAKYFTDTNPGRNSLIRSYYDSQGNVYNTDQIRELWSQVQQGTLGSGQYSTLGTDGGYADDGTSTADTMDTSRVGNQSGSSETSPDGSAEDPAAQSEGSEGDGTESEAAGGTESAAGSEAAGTAAGAAAAGGDTGGGTSAVAGSASSGSTGGSGKASAHGFRPGLFFICLMLGLAVFAILYEVLKRQLDAQNMLNDTSDINQYPNDQHIQLPEEMQRNYDWFPDVGAHSSVMVSGMLSHMMLQNKGLKKVEVTRRADKDILDEDGDVAYLKSEPLLDDNGDVIKDKLPIIDEAFGDALFTASGAPKEKSIRKKYDATKISYNPGNENRDKLKGYDTVADLINGDWTFPEYEVQRPAGAYIVDTNPVNTMV